MTETLPWWLGDEWSLAVGVLDGSDWLDWNQRVKVGAIESPRLLRRFDANTWVRLASFQQQGHRQTEIIPVEAHSQPSNSVQANLGGMMELQGYDLSPLVGQAGRDLLVTLHWRALAPVDRNYTVFVHMLGPDGKLVAQHDGEPWWEVSLPTTTWQPGEELRDQHLLTLPPDLAPGTYFLQVGVYYWETLERLPMMEDNVPVNDLVKLGSFEVER